MDIYISFHIVALIMLLITLIFCGYKNWILVAKNRIFFEMAMIETIALEINIVLCLIYEFSGQYLRYLGMAIQALSSIFALLVYHRIFLYNLAMTENVLASRKWWSRLLGFLSALCMLSSALPLAFHLAGGSHGQVQDIAAKGRVAQSGVVILCLLLAGGVLLISRKKMTGRDFAVLFGSDLILLADVVWERLMDSRYLTSYYLMAFVLVVYYMLLHNLDRYKVLASGCFARAGFRTVLREKEICRENIRCLGVCINNIESITNCCSESEIVEIHRQIGSLLKRHCGRHQVFHIHSFEYVVTCKPSVDIGRKHQELAQLVPAYIRMNNKNVSLFCDFYTIDFKDADYQTGNFFGILTSMRKLAMAYMDRMHLLRYCDDSKNDIEKDMEAMRIVNACIATKNFSLQIFPIQSKDDEEKFCYEFAICAKYGDGEVISQELIWEMAGQMGYHREMGLIVFELVCKYIMLNKLRESVVERIHLNLEGTQISGAELAKGYIDLLEKYQIPGDFICIEVTVEQDVDYDAMEQAFVLLREKGVGILLDQFGVTVCNLKTVLNMSFHGVKINHHMVSLFCNGISEQLLYMLDMLNTSGWKIILDGVDRAEYVPLLKDLKFAYMQGLLLQEDFEKKHEPVIFREIGGAAYE